VKQEKQDHKVRPRVTALGLSDISVV